MDEHFSYIRVYGCEVAPHTLTMSIPDRFLLREIAYQTTITGLSKALQKAQKKIWPIFPIKVGIYSLKNSIHAKEETNYLEEIWMHTQKCKRRDLKGIVQLNGQSIINLQTFIHEQSTFDFLFQGSSEYEEVKMIFLNMLDILEKNWYLNVHADMKEAYVKARNEIQGFVVP